MKECQSFNSSKIDSWTVIRPFPSGLSQHHARTVHFQIDILTFYDKQVVQNNRQRGQTFEPYLNFQFQRGISIF